MRRRLSLGGAIALATVLFAQVCAITGAQAQAFPNRVVKFVVPYTTGGATDAAAPVPAAFTITG